MFLNYSAFMLLRRRRKLLVQPSPGERGYPPLRGDRGLVAWSRVIKNWLKWLRS